MAKVTSSCRFVGGISDGQVLPLTVGPDGMPPMRVTFFGGTVEATYVRGEKSDLLGGWIYRYTDPTTASEETP